MADDDNGYQVGNGKVERVTEKALLFDMGTEEKVWIPKSQLHNSTQVREEGDEGVLVISSWLAEAKGFTKNGEETNRPPPVEDDIPF